MAARWTGVIGTALGILGAQAGDLTGQTLPVTERSAPAWTHGRSFADIQSAIELSDGRLLVVDRIERVVVALDPDGEGARQVGRSGRGPGEYMEPWFVFRATGDTAVVYDTGQMRLLVVAPDESVPAGGSWPVTTGVAPRFLDAQGRFLFDERGKIVTDRNGRVDESAAPLVRLDAASGQADTVTTLAVRDLAARWEASPVSRMFRPGPGGFARFRLRDSPFGAQDEWVALPDGGIAVARLEPFRVEIFGADGTRTTGPTVEWTPVPVTRADRTAWQEAALRGQPAGATGSFEMEGGGSRPIQPAEPEFRDEDFPETKPPFPWRGLHAGPDGSLWIQTYAPAGAAHTELLELGGRGAPTRTVRIPADRHVIAIGARHVYAVAYDALDLQRVEAYAR